MDPVLPLEEIANRYREVVIAALIAVNQRISWFFPKGIQQEALAAAMVLGTQEALAVILSEIFKEDQQALASVFPRCEEIVQRAVAHIQTTGHLPGCSCPSQQ